MYMSPWEWSLAFFAGVVVVLLSLWLIRSRSNLRLREAKREIDQLEQRICVARTCYLETLQRELANVILSANLEAFEVAFYFMRDWEHEIGKSGRDRRLGEYKLLLEKFPRLEDFDLIGTKHFILYDDRPSWRVDQLVERYKEVSKFLIVDENRLPYPKAARYNEREIEIFGKAIKIYRDLRLKEAIEIGMRRYYLWRKDRDADGNVYEDNEYGVVLLSELKARGFTPGLEWGVFCKKLKEYGLYTHFGHDGEDDYRYFRSNSTFSIQQVLLA